MVSDLTRFSACKVNPETPGKPLSVRDAAKVEARRPARQDPTGDEPVRLFVWASA